MIRFHTYYRATTVKNIGCEKTSPNLVNYSISSIFTISITFPMQMNFNFRQSFFRQISYSPYLPNFLLPKFLSVRYWNIALQTRFWYYMVNVALADFPLILLRKVL